MGFPLCQNPTSGLSVLHWARLCPLCAPVSLRIAEAYLLVLPYFLGGPNMMKEDPFLFSESSQTLPSGTNGGQELWVRLAPRFIGGDPSTHP